MRISTIQMSPFNLIKHNKTNNLMQKALSSSSPNDNFEKKTNSPSFTGPCESKALTQLVKNGITDMYSKITLLESNEVFQLINRGAFSGSSQKAVETLKPYYKNMLTVEKKVFKTLERLSLKFPEENMQQLLGRVNKKNERKLIKKQMPIFKNILLICKELPEQYHEEFFTLFRQAKNEIFHKNTDKTFSNKRFSYALLGILKKSQNTKLQFRAIKEIEKLPTSFTYEPSFIVKNARKTPDEIGFAMLINSTASIEHLLPASLNGECKISNYGLASKGWNSYFGNMKLYERIAIMPQIIANSKKQIKQLIELSNQGLIKPEVVLSITESYEKESRGLIKVNTSKLKMDAYKNRQKEEIDSAIFIGKLQKYGWGYIKSNNIIIPSGYKMLQNTRNLYTSA